MTLTVPTYLISTAGTPFAAVGPAFIAICLPPPDVPVGTPGRATFGAKVYSAELAINGVFSPVTTGAWLSSWVPYTPGAGKPNPAGQVVAPAAILPGAIRLAAKRSGLGATLAGAVTQAGQPRAGASVTIYGGRKATGLKRLGKAKVAANGRFAFRAKAGTFFRADAVAAGGLAPSVCTTIQPLLGGIPCVNPTANGFVAKSKVVRKK